MQNLTGRGAGRDITGNYRIGSFLKTLRLALTPYFFRGSRPFQVGLVCYCAWYTLYTPHHNMVSGNTELARHEPPRPNHLSRTVFHIFPDHSADTQKLHRIASESRETRHREPLNYMVGHAVCAMIGYGVCTMAGPRGGKHDRRTDLAVMVVMHLSGFWWYGKSRFGSKLFSALPHSDRFSAASVAKHSKAHQHSKT